MLYILLVAASVLCSGTIQVNGQCTTPGCLGSSAGTDVNVEKILEDHDQKLNGMFKSLMLKIEQNEKSVQSIVQQMTEVYMSAKYKVCPPGFRYLEDANGCFKIIFQKLNWMEAGNECKKLIPGAHLAAITNHSKQIAVADFLKTEIAKDKSSACLFSDGDNWNEGQLTVWTSGQTTIPDRCNSTYQWKILDSMKIPFDYKNWIILEPSCGHKHENCLQMVAGRTNTYEWNDLNCERKTCALCEL